MKYIFASKPHYIGNFPKIERLLVINLTNTAVQFHPMRKSILLFLLSLIAIAAFTSLGPAEKTLGANARVVYLHGVWVWAAMAAFAGAALAGAVGLIARKENLHSWSLALGRTGLFFWLTYLPISMWAMQTNWNGLFLAEPRWRFAIIFAIGGLIIQIGITLMEDTAWASAANLAYFLALMLSLANTENVMHPPSPILNSNAWRIQLFFGGLFLLALIAVGLLTRWWYQLERARAHP
jgi:hypothetical protein